NPQDDSPPRTRLKHLFQPADRRVRVLPVNHKRDDFLSSSQMESAINVFSGFASRAIRDEGLLADRIPALRDRPLEINFTLIASQGRDFLPCPYRKVRLSFFSYTYSHLVLTVNLPLLTIPIR